MNNFEFSKLQPPDKSNMLECAIYPDAKTLPIFDEFVKPDYLYLLIKWAGRFKMKIKFHLLVSKIPFELKQTNLKSSGVLTPTFLKNANLYINSKKQISQFIALKALAEEIYNALYKKDAQKGDVFYFENAVAFYAQDSAFRSGFGLPRHSTSPYDDNVLYGETRTFAIIGVIIA